MSSTYFIRERKDRNFTVIDNTCLKDERLSWKAKGVFVYLLSLPENWKIHYSEIATHAKDGRDSLRNAVNELKEFGYLTVEQRKNEKGQFCENVYRIIENPRTETPYTENPNTVKATLLNTNNNKDLNILNTDNRESTDTASVSDTPKRSTFKKPTLEEIKEYCRERKNTINAEHFFDYYESNGWQVGKNKMKDWKATVRTWEQRDRGYYGNYTSKKGGAFDHIPSEKAWHEKVMNMEEDPF